MRQTLQKNKLKPWLKKGWCIPPEANAEFVAALEDVLEVSHRPHDPARPPVCFDEAAKQLLADVRAPLPMRPGCPERQDSEYQREGTAVLFMVCEPLAGRRHVFVRARRTRLDFAAVIKTLCDELSPAAEKIVLVLDQLNTHGVASRYSAYPPAEARRLAFAAGNPPSAQARKLAERGRDRTLRPGSPVPGRTPGKPAAAHHGRRCMGTNPKRGGGAHRLALYHGRCPPQTQAPLPTATTLKEH